MADYIIVAGDVNEYVKKMFQRKNDINIVNTFKTVDSLTNTVIDNGTAFLQVVDAIVMLDYGFESGDEEGRAGEFIYLQDTLKSNSMQRTKLYLITRNTNLYAMLRGEVEGIPGVHYVNTEVMLIDGDYAAKILGDIMKGRRDRTGLYHPDVDKENLTARMQDDRKAFIEDSQTVDREILLYGRDEPVSELSSRDFSDSRETERGILQRERQKLEEEKSAARRKRQADIKSGKIPEDYYDGDDSGEDQPIVNRRGRSTVQVRNTSEPLVTGTLERGRGVPNIGRMQDTFNLIGKEKNLDGKLEADSGVLAFIGERKAGTSGIVANVADIYASKGKRVLVIDGDIIHRSQTLYFRNYDEQVQNHYGVGNGLIKVTQGGSIQRTAVQITSRIDILGVSRTEEIKEEQVTAVADALHDIIEEARHLYDIVLVDVPYNYFEKYLTGLSGTNKNILVVENRWYDIENFIDLSLGKHYKDHADEMVAFFKKSTVILNKYKRGRVDLTGADIDKARLTTTLREKGYPFDLIGVAGELPYYEDWERQYLTRIRYIWMDELAKGVYENIFSKVVW